LKISVIFTTYNSPDWLQKVLWGFEQQTDDNFEIVIADKQDSELSKEVRNYYGSKTQKFYGYDSSEAIKKITDSKNFIAVM